MSDTEDREKAERLIVDVRMHVSCVINKQPEQKLEKGCLGFYDDHGSHFPELQVCESFQVGVHLPLLAILPGNVAQCHLVLFCRPYNFCN